MLIIPSAMLLLQVCALLLQQKIAYLHQPLGLDLVFLPRRWLGDPCPSSLWLRDLHHPSHPHPSHWLAMCQSNPLCHHHHCSFVWLKTVTRWPRRLRVSTVMQCDLSQLLTFTTKLRMWQIHRMWVWMPLMDLGLRASRAESIVSLFNTLSHAWPRIWEGNLVYTTIMRKTPVPWCVSQIIEDICRALLQGNHQCDFSWG